VTILACHDSLEATIHSRLLVFDHFACHNSLFQRASGLAQQYEASSVWYMCLCIHIMTHLQYEAFSVWCMCLLTERALYWSDVVAVDPWGSTSAWCYQSWSPVGDHAWSLLLQRSGRGLFNFSLFKQCLKVRYEGIFHSVHSGLHSVLATRLINFTIECLT